MKKILGLILAMMIVIGAVANGNAQEKTMVEVHEVDNFSYEIEYSNGEKEKVIFDNELECAEEYTDVWYEIHGEETKMIDVKIIDDYSFEIVYSDGEKTTHTYDTELECAEEYTDVWYEIQGNLTL